jgi:hypothetical protein
MPARGTMFVLILVILAGVLLLMLHTYPLTP